MLLVGSVAAPRAHAQLPTTLPDSILKARADSIAKADSIGRPLPRAEAPVLAEGVWRHRFAGDSLYVNGALTLADLLERIPGVTTFRARFYTAPMVGSVLGDPGRIRLFVDGVETEPFDPRSGGVYDLSLFPVATLEEVVVERAADELRLHLRTWRPATVVQGQSRLDILTGDDRANSFRGFVSRRFRPGWLLQATVQQRSLTDSPLFAGDGDALTAFARVGYVAPSWGLDATLLRHRATRATLLPVPLPGLENGRSIPGMELADQLAMLRATWRDAERGGPWLQVTAAIRGMNETSPRRTGITPRANSGIRLDTADTNLARRQYVVAGGWRAGALRLSATGRFRDDTGTITVQPSVRAAFETSRAVVALFGERSPFDRTTRAEAQASVRPVPWLLLQGAASLGTTGTADVVTDSLGTVGPVELPRTRAVRAEAGVKVGSLWVTGGLLARDSALLRPPIVFDQRYEAVVDGPARALMATVAGPLVRGFSTHLHAVQWSEAGLYRPRRQFRGELAYRTRWLRRFPSGNFDLRVAGIVEYRDRVAFPLVTGDVSATSSGILGLSLDLRIRDAVISWQFRNPTGTTYTTVPGLLMNQAMNVYGVRWTFSN